MGVHTLRGKQGNLQFLCYCVSRGVLNKQQSTQALRALVVMQELGLEACVVDICIWKGYLRRDRARHLATKVCQAYRVEFGYRQIHQISDDMDAFLTRNLPPIEFRALTRAMEIRDILANHGIRRHLNEILMDMKSVRMVHVLRTVSRTRRLNEVGLDRDFPFNDIPVDAVHIVGQDFVQGPEMETMEYLSVSA